MTRTNFTYWGFIALIAFGLLAPHLGVYPTFLMKCWCFALFACAFNLLLGYTGLLSFGHAAFIGAAGYIAGPMASACRSCSPLRATWVSSMTRPCRVWVSAC